jgi:hypothetical protein
MLLQYVRGAEPHREHAESGSCWTAPLAINLDLPPWGEGNRCSLRSPTLPAAKAACLSQAWCGGVAKDGGLACQGEKQHFELRTRKEIDVGQGQDAKAWLRVLGRRNSTSCAHVTVPLARAEGWLLPSATGAGGLSRRTPSSLVPARPHHHPAKGDGRAREQAGGRHVETMLKLTTRSPGRIYSRAHCVGPCCSQPLHRNRTCAFRDLLFRPPSSFFFLSTDDAGTEDQHATFLHNRFADGSTTGTGARSKFTPRRLDPSEADSVTRVVEAPLYIGADIHSNIGHLMLDSVFPSVISMLRLRASHGVNHSVRSQQKWLPDPVTGNFTFLLYDSPSYVNWHRGKKERAWTSTLSGKGVVDLAQLASACAGGCIVRAQQARCGAHAHTGITHGSSLRLEPLLAPLNSTPSHNTIVRSIRSLLPCAQIRTSWSGAGHVGLCSVDGSNFLGGSHEHRALYRYRNRIYHMFGVPHTPPLAAEQHGPPTVLVVQSKRVVTNMQAFVDAIRRIGGVNARLIKWEDLSFVEQLRTIRGAAVQISGVGSAQMNQFLLPRGSVAISLGWRNERSRNGIYYFDSHILRSLDHARALYYPSYDRNELAAGQRSVRLDLKKAVALVKEALAIHHAGFATPLPEGANANRFDRAFSKLVKLTNGSALMARTDDYVWGSGAYPKGCTTRNGVEDMIWPGVNQGPAPAGACPWQSHLPQLIREFDL